MFILLLVCMSSLIFVCFEGLGESSDVKTTGYGDLGMIDNKDVPSLVLQLLLCKCKSTFKRASIII